MDHTESRTRGRDVNPTRPRRSLYDHPNTDRRTDHTHPGLSRGGHPSGGARPAHGGMDRARTG
jgi:hypothetical protein